MKYTVDDIMAEGPCQEYTEERVEELWAGRHALTPREIASLDIPVEDRIWALSRMLLRTSPHSANRVSRLIALDVAHLWDCPDSVWWYLTSGDESSRSAASAATWAASRSAARYEARYAARAADSSASSSASSSAALDAASAAALDASSAAALDAASAAVLDAASAAAWAAELQRHLDTLVRAWEVPR